MAGDNQDSLKPVLDRLTALHPKLIDLGLERTYALSHKCGAPHEKLPPVIHIAGTNGKGSVSAFLASLYRAAGLRAHCYTSPHLCRFNERIRLAGKLIDTAELIALLNEVEERNAGAPVTFFESTTIAAFLAFSRHPADILILETGLGGLFDSTNIIPDHLASVITPIARDHEQFLGSDLAGIARQKAGIMRAHRPCISARQTDGAGAALTDCAAALGCPIYYESRDFSVKQLPDRQLSLVWQDETITAPAPSLSGPHQYKNAGLALAAFKLATPATLTKSVCGGIGEARWPGRIQRLEKGRLAELLNGAPLWLDGAHNAHGADALVATLKQLSDKNWQIVFGALNTRPAEEFLRQLLPVADKIHTLTIPGQDAALSAGTLADTAGKLGIPAQPSTCIRTALTAIAAADTQRHSRLPVIICGSLYLAGHILYENGTLPD